MKIYVAGFPVKHVDEPSQAPEPQAESNLPSVAEAIRLANERAKQVLTYTQEQPVQSPLKQNLRTDGPTFEMWVDAGYTAETYPPAGYAELDSPALTEYKASLREPNEESDAFELAAAARAQGPTNY